MEVKEGREGLCVSQGDKPAIAVIADLQDWVRLADMGFSCGIKGGSSATNYRRLMTLETGTSLGWTA